MTLTNLRAKKWCVIVLKPQIVFSAIGCLQIPRRKAINLIKPRNRPKVTRPFFPCERTESGHETRRASAPSPYSITRKAYAKIARKMIHSVELHSISEERRVVLQWCLRQPIIPLAECSQCNILLCKILWRLFVHPQAYIRTCNLQRHHTISRPAHCIYQLKLNSTLLCLVQPSNM